jgi:hypothetical protein
MIFDGLKVKVFHFISRIAAERQLTGRREFIQRSPHQVSCKIRFRRSGPTSC